MLGDNIRKYRKAKKLTAKELGKKVGLAESTISGYENGLREPNIPTLMKLSEILDVSVDSLIGSSEVSDPQVNDLAFDNLEGLTVEDLKKVKGYIETLKRHREELDKFEKE
ncbi:transcriptional regulator [Listeria grandensis FSL F6-0971]|uniref:Transcriptional regulator n=1 Tax=Listeria grandensis FSL F6-0971 TaxID=1265819 RepID=W7BDR9_9LIST|nr:helix-turn-helix transcriptional regulator [Listeria grandensis]EUJ22965.1 transcriptional regulator [Listeria grandensis FSL F6-0971]